MRRAFLALILFALSSLAHAGMTFFAMAVAPSEVEAVAADDSTWEALEKERDGSTVDLDKAWHGLHYLLTNSAWDSESTLGQALMGGTPIGKDRGYGPLRLLQPDQVRDVADALGQLSRDMLARRFDPAAMERAQIYPSGIWEGEGPEALDDLLVHFDLLRDFYRKAAERRRSVLLLIS